MEYIYSKTESDVLLAIIVRPQDFLKPRNEIVPATEFLQGAAIRVSEGDKFRPHKHIWRPFKSDYGMGDVKAQECWIVLRGVIRITVYDFDDSPINTTVIADHCAVFLLHGGHTFECLEDNSFIFELKNGPYYGQANDKTFIE